MENFVNIQPTVTIMVTFYNQKKYIGECLEFILNQKTNFYFEILCGDDGSADGTYEELLFWERHYPNIIKTYRMPRDTSKEYEPIVRVSNNRISLLKNAKGKYITFLDGDDYYSDCCKLQKQVDALEKHPECVGCGHPINMKWEENPTRPAQSVGTVASKAVIIPRKIYWRYLWLHADTLLFRNVIRDKVESIDHNFFDDNIIACYFLKFGDFIYLPESMAVYRQIGESSWNRRSELQKAYVNMHVYKSSLEILDGMKRDSFIKCYVAWKEFYKNRKKTIKLDKDMGGLEEIRFVEKTLQYKDSNFIFKLKYELMYGPIMHSGFIIKCFRKLRVFAYKKV